MAASGGVGPLLGTAAHPELREKISGLVVMSGKAPWEMGTSFEENITEDNKTIYKAAQDNLQALRKKITRRAQRIQIDKFSLMKMLYPSLKGNEGLYFIAEGLFQAIAIGHADGLRQNGDRWYDDILAFQKPSGFDVSTIQAPTVIWHGAKDPFGAVEDSYWLKSQIPHAELVIDQEAAHFGNLSMSRSALGWLRNQTIGPERVVEIQRLQETWLNEWIGKFNGIWSSTPFARGNYAADDYDARDSIRNGIIRSIEMRERAEEIAVRTVLEEYNANSSKG